MNDDFMRRLRPVPRAAFVHELKARLDRQSTPLVGRPSVLRTLIVALLVGGAAFAVTMMATRHETTGRAASSAPLAQSAGTQVDEAAPVPQSAQVQAEITPVIPRNVRRQVESGVLEPAFETSEPAVQAPGPTAAAAVANAPPAQVASGLAVGGVARVRGIDGFGSMFPFPLYDAWGNEYRRLTGVQVYYASMGSGGGLKLLKINQANFAATDVPLPAGELKASGLLQFPMVISAAVPIVRLDGVATSRITLDGPTLASIYLGEITRWDDSRIHKLNPDLVLPGTRITLVYRSDGASATYLLTEYLSKASMTFQSRYGARTDIDVTPAVAARGDDGMAAVVGRTDGAIGYLDYNYARRKSIPSIRLINKAARVVPAAPESLQSAAAHADWTAAPGLAVSLADMPGERSWPIVGATYIVVHSDVNSIRTGTVLEFFDWAYRNGSKTATQLGFVMVPPAVGDLVRSAWSASAKGAPKSASSQ